MSVDFGWKDAAAHIHQRIVLPPILTTLRRQGHSLHILDLGCGNGWLTDQYRLAGHSVVGCDRADDGLALARVAYPLVKFVNADVYGDLTAIDPLGFDAIVCSEVIEHLYDPAAMVARVFAALRPGSVFIVTTPYHGYAKNLAIALLGRWDRHHGVADQGGHIKFFSQKSLEAMLKAAGFGQIAFRGAGRLPFLWKSMVVTATKPSLYDELSIGRH